MRREGIPKFARRPHEGLRVGLRRLLPGPDAAHRARELDAPSPVSLAGVGQRDLIVIEGADHIEADVVSIHLAIGDVS